MQVVWSASSLDDQEAILGYLEPLNPHAAVKLLEALVLAGDSLETFPQRGRPGLAHGTRELAAVWPYVVVYEIDDEAQIIRILRVWHGAQDR